MAFQIVYTQPKCYPFQHQIDLIYYHLTDRHQALKELKDLNEILHERALQLVFLQYNMSVLHLHKVHFHQPKKIIIQYDYLSIWNYSSTNITILDIAIT